MRFLDAVLAITVVAFASILSVGMTYLVAIAMGVEESIGAAMFYIVASILPAAIIIHLLEREENAD